MSSELPVESHKELATAPATTQDARFLWALANKIHSSKILPRGFDTVEKLFVALMFLKELKLPLIPSLAYVAVLDGKPMLYGHLALALVMRSGLFDHSKFKEEFIYDDAGNVVAVQCTMARLGGQTVTRQFTLEDAKRAGLLSKPGPWQNYTARMLQMRARSWALKDLFPDIIAGAIYEDMLGDIQETSVSQAAADRLYQRIIATRGIPEDEDPPEHTE